jgi:hypothetical protein
MMNTPKKVVIEGENVPGKRTGEGRNLASFRRKLADDRRRTFRLPRRKQVIKVIAVELLPIRTKSNEPVLIERSELATFEQLAVPEMVIQPSDLWVNGGFVPPASSTTNPRENLLHFIERICTRPDADVLFADRFVKTASRTSGKPFGCDDRREFGNGRLPILYSRGS